MPGFVSVGISDDTAEFAVESLRKWGHEMGAREYPAADSLSITADSGGSNGGRVRLWKVQLQELADELGIPLKVSHFPPGTSKWNKMEHRLFSFIGKNWRGKPLVGLAVIVSLIGATPTKTGLKVKCVIDRNEYSKGIRVSDYVLAKVNLTRAAMPFMVNGTTKSVPNAINSFNCKCYLHALLYPPEQEMRSFTNFTR